MMAFLYVLIVVSMYLAYRGKRKTAIILFFITIALSIFWFKYHITDHLDIDL
jgi:hypothetical protein